MLRNARGEFLLDTLAGSTLAGYLDAKRPQSALGLADPYRTASCARRGGWEFVRILEPEQHSCEVFMNLLRYRRVGLHLIH